MKDLTYGYEPESPVLKNLDVQFDAGKSYAILRGQAKKKIDAFESSDGKQQ